MIKFVAPIMRCLNCLIFIGLIGFASHVRLSAQSAGQQKIEALNEYVEFLNASVHGLSIAQVILVNYNKVINKYVDINSHELTQISNKDLPQNIFGGTDAYLSFYDQSDTPENLYKSCKTKSAVLDQAISTQLNEACDQIIQVLRDINKIRFDVESYIQDHDLNEREAIYGVYEYLERGVALFENYAIHHHGIAQILDNNGRQSTNSLLKSMTTLHRTNKIILTSLRREEDKNSERNLSQLKIVLKNFENEIVGSRLSSPGWRKNTEDIIKKNNSIIDKLETFVTTAYVPLEEEIYGKFYHYHNFMLRYMNWYGPGYVRSMNSMIDELNLPSIYYDEEPIIYKVIYPMKMQEIENLYQSSLPEKLPNKIRGRDLVFNNKVISADSNYIELELYDHQILDRDTVSINFNGKWVLEDLALTEKPYKLVIALDTKEENYLVLHAKNLGLISPNTLAISYRYLGKRRRIFLESNLDKSEVVEIVIDGTSQQLPIK